MSWSWSQPTRPRDAAHGRQGEDGYSTWHYRRRAAAPLPSDPVNPRTVRHVLTRPFTLLGRALGYLLSGGLFAAVVYVGLGGLLTAPLGLVTQVVCGLLVVAFAVALAGPFEHRRLA